ncbi:MAG TPA: NADH-ubiquinone oxidoreductase-F iron-sulfur binding region domain-containing protein [Acidimicrobiia bacterium]|nr:NADH-ubiquinone oxidoreductase-F iron-sulfur binding region domain-containing protein [Acidimicrobiia bacterium]
MDLRLMDAEPTPAELAVVERIAPASEEVAVPGRVVRGGHQARGQRHLLLPALAAVQSEIGWVSPGALNAICRRLLIPPAEAYGVATFYALISVEERPPVVAHVCDDIACRQAGGSELLAALAGREEVVSSPCLGQCDRRPAVFLQRAGREDAVILGADPASLEAALGGHIAEPAPLRVEGSRLLRRIGRIDPTSLDEYRSQGGYQALSRSIELGRDRVIDEIKRSGLKGRGGAAFPTGVKWEAVAREPPPRYVVCNADESEPGTFKDRVVMEGDPFAVIESITITGYATGAERGYLYIRGEYPLATKRLEEAIETAREQGLLGENILGSGFSFDIEVRRGQGAYICGEETALFNSIEGFRGEPRQKPPFPVQFGLFGRPTAINNVETLVNVPGIVLEGGDSYAQIGTPDSTGTRLFCLSGDIERPGVYEVESGETLGAVIDLAGGVVGELGTILLGGAAGSMVGPEHLDLRLTFEDARAAGVSLGSGVIMAFNRTRDLRDIVRRVARFFRDESCGQCVPCRVGTVRVEEAVARADGTVEASLIEELDRAMKDASICGLGHTAASVVRSAIARGLLGVPR